MLPDAQPATSTNLSARQLLDPGIAAQVAEPLRANHLPAAPLCLEVTETAAVVAVPSARANLAAIVELGANSPWTTSAPGTPDLARLRPFRADHLKLHRQFIGGMDLAATDAAIVEGAVQPAHPLGTTVTAGWCWWRTPLANLGP